MASPAGRTWKIRAFKPTSAAESMSAFNCSFCFATGSPGSLGQLMLCTVASHDPRSSRAGGGTLVWACSVAVSSRESGSRNFKGMFRKRTLREQCVAEFFHLVPY